MHVLLELVGEAALSKWLTPFLKTTLEMKPFSTKGQQISIQKHLCVDSNLFVISTQSDLRFFHVYQYMHILHCQLLLKADNEDRPVHLGPFPLFCQSNYYVNSEYARN